MVRVPTIQRLDTGVAKGRIEDYMKNGLAFIHPGFENQPMNGYVLSANVLKALLMGEGHSMLLNQCITGGGQKITILYMMLISECHA